MASRTNDRLGERLTARTAQFTPTLRRVAEYIASHRENVLAMSAIEIGAAIGTSDATVIRTVQALGFAGLPDLKRAIAATHDNASTPSDDLLNALAQIDDADAAIDEVIASHMQAVNLLRGQRTALCEAISLLSGANRVAFHGVGPMSSLARYAHEVFARNGRSGIVVQASGDGIADDLLHLELVNALLMLTHAEAQHEAEAAIVEARRLAIPVIVISSDPADALQRSANVFIPVPQESAGNIALHATMVVCIEALLLGVTAQDPGRALAALMKRNDLKQTFSGRGRVR